MNCDPSTELETLEDDAAVREALDHEEQTACLQCGHPFEEHFQALPDQPGTCFGRGGNCGCPQYMVRNPHWKPRLTS